MTLPLENGAFTAPGGVSVTGTGILPSAFDVTGLAVASIADAGNAVADLAARLGSPRPAVSVDRGLASLWFGMSFTPVGWTLPSPWDAIAGDYPCADGWIRLHTNAPHHLAAALAVLGLGPEASRPTVADAVARWTGEDLEDAVVAANGCAAVMRSSSQWLAHPQGAAVAAEPLVHWSEARSLKDPLKDTHDAGRYGHGSPATAARPLAGVRVLDLTRVIAGPVATRFLAQYGAEVLRIDPPDWNEPALEPEMTLGKACARLDLKAAAGLATLHELLAGADLFIHGYRPDALARLGLDDDSLAERYPGLVNIALDAYGWSGPWAPRRGFDSLVQMSCGIAHAGMESFGTDKPRPLPVQALDHATGYLTAAAAVRAWTQRLDGQVVGAKLSLARTAVELVRTGPSEQHHGGAAGLPRASAADLIPEDTGWGAGVRLRPALTVDGIQAHTPLPARGYGSAGAGWPAMV
jgi:crotonobetainyl-CoA:carnitine CoA-transferase CaiB-like acyl-CoA transferase